MPTAFRPAEPQHTHPHQQAGAVCRSADPDMFFSEHPTDALRAVALCLRCPLLEACAEDGLGLSTLGDAGVWGGLTVEARRRIRRGVSRVAAEHVLAHDAIEALARSEAAAEAAAAAVSAAEGRSVPLPVVLASVDEVLRYETGLGLEGIRRHDRTPPVTAARNVVYLALAEDAGLSSTRIGRALGRDHSSVLSGTKRARHLVATDDGARQLRDRLRRTLTWDEVTDEVTDEVA